MSIACKVCRVDLLLPCALWPAALCPLPSALCPLPSALCPLPSALCPLPSALCPGQVKLAIRGLPMLADAGLLLSCACQAGDKRLAAADACLLLSSCVVCRPSWRPSATRRPPPRCPARYRPGPGPALESRGGGCSRATEQGCSGGGTESPWHVPTATQESTCRLRGTCRRPLVVALL